MRPAGLCKTLPQLQYALDLSNESQMRQSCFMPQRILSFHFLKPRPGLIKVCLHLESGPNAGSEDNHDEDTLQKIPISVPSTIWLLTMSELSGYHLHIIVIKTSESSQSIKHR